MNRSIEKIKKFIKDQQYLKALELIESELSSKFNFNIDVEEQRYSALLKWRVTVKTLAGQDDQLILDTVWKEKHASMIEYSLEGGKKVHLTYKNAFDFDCDAYVNTIHAKKLFKDAVNISATRELVKRVDSNEIENQLSRYNNLKKSDFILIDHPHLSAPMSYNILFYEDSGYDLEALSKGIINVLNHATRQGLSKISFFPIGFDLVNQANEDDKFFIADEITNKVAETVVNFLNEKKDEFLPQIYFNFAVVKTMTFFDNAFKRWSMMTMSQLKALKSQSKREGEFFEKLGTYDTNYRNLIKEIFYAFDDPSTILLQGETGSGKSYLAELIHKSSSRASNKLVKENCTLIKGGTIRQYLFGWTKGSFTDAYEDGVGAIERAEGGTLFLDEIGYADIDVQKLLSEVIMEGTYSRFGEDGVVRRANVRFIFGTNVNLEDAVNQGIFQKDLYYGINKYAIELPPLRKRLDDIPLLSNKIIKKLNDTNNTTLKINEKALELLKSYPWPGNIRQLEVYLEKQFNYCKYYNISFLTYEIIKKDPPSSNFFRIRNPYMELESSLKQILNGFDFKNYKIVQDIIQPILAKIYVEDIKGKLKDSIHFVEMDGTRGEDSNLKKKYHLYQKMKEQFYK
jgi:transcriptional regulator with AAA-type ATPase domain